MSGDYDPVHLAMLYTARDEARSPIHAASIDRAIKHIEGGAGKVEPAPQAKSQDEQMRDPVYVLGFIANAKRFDRLHFDDDTAFADWAQSLARHALTPAAPRATEGSR